KNVLAEILVQKKLLRALCVLCDKRRDMELTWNRYGKSRVRLVKVNRARDPHELIDLTIDVQLEGAFESVYVDGDNAACLATDTMKNTVYAFARQAASTRRAPRATAAPCGRRYTRSRRQVLTLRHTSTK